MKSHLILPDLHSPAYNKPLVEAVLKYIYLNRDYLTGIVFSGDTLDIQSINAYATGSLTDTTLGAEYEVANTLLDMFDQALGKGKETTFMYGNHEDRLRKSLSILAMSKLGTAIRDIQSGLNLAGRGYNVLDGKEDTYQIDDLSVIHGVYYNIHCSKKTSEVYKCNIMFGHTHRIQTFDENIYAAYNIGWMGEVNHRYFSFATKGQKSYWANAFAKVDSFNGVTSPKTVKWMGDHFILDGRIYK